MIPVPLICACVSQSAPLLIYLIPHPRPLKASTVICFIFVLHPHLQPCFVNKAVNALRQFQMLQS